MSENAQSQERIDAFNRAHNLYWMEVVQLKVESVYIEQYRERLTRWLSWFTVGRAIVSVGALASWFAGVGHPEVWGGIIVVSQVAEAVITALPLAARLKNLNAFATSLEAMLIDALLEWEDINSGELTARDITRRRHALMRLRHDSEAKNLPTGLPMNGKLFGLAEKQTASYFEAIYGTKPGQGS